MDYNSRSKVFEVVGIDGYMPRKSFYTDNEETAKEKYELYKQDFKTVLFCWSRKGMKAGSIEADE
jgi:hypothetical protein